MSSIDPRVDIGHVHLKVSEIDWALGFWRDVLALKPGAVAAELGLNTGPDVASLAPAQREPYEGGEISLVRNGHLARGCVCQVVQIGDHDIEVGLIRRRSSWRPSSAP